MNAELEKAVGLLIEGCASPRNKQKGGAQPAITVGLEEPICWVKLFGCDIKRFFTDAAYHAEQIIKYRLWRFRNIADDAPLEGSLTASFGYYNEYTFCGMDVQFNADGVPVIDGGHPMTRSPDISLLAPVDFYSSGCMPRLLRWREELEGVTENRLAVRMAAWWRGPLDLAVQLRGYESLMSDAAENPGFVHSLMRWLTEQRMAWFTAYNKHFGLPGAPMGIGDDWINIPFITPSFFEEFILPHYRALEDFHGGISAVHSCGNQTLVQPYLMSLPTLRTLEVSPWTSLEGTIRQVPGDYFLIVTSHPNDVLYSSPAAIREKLSRVRSLCEGRRYAISTSGLTPQPGPSCEKVFLDKIHVWLDIAQNIFH